MIWLGFLKEKEVIKKLEGLKGKAPSVIARAINRAVENARTNMAKKAIEGYYIRQKDVKNTISIYKANPKKLKATIKSKGTRRPLIQFKVNPSKPNPQKPPKVLKVAVKKSGLKPLLNAFVAKGKKSGKIMVLQRQTKKRYPLFQKYGISVPEMLGTKYVRKYVEDEAREVLARRLDHEIGRILGGAK